MIFGRFAVFQVLDVFVDSGMVPAQFLGDLLLGMALEVEVEVTGWTQQRIAKAKGVDQATVSRRLKFNSMSDKVKKFMAQGLIDEGHLREIITIMAQPYLSPWLTTSQAWEELRRKRSMTGQRMAADR